MYLSFQVNNLPGVLILYSCFLQVNSLYGTQFGILWISKNIGTTGIHVEPLCKYGFISCLDHCLPFDQVFTCLCESQTEKKYLWEKGNNSDPCKVRVKFLEMDEEVFEIDTRNRTCCKRIYAVSVVLLKYCFVGYLVLDLVSKIIYTPQPLYNTIVGIQSKNHIG